jgi:two-component system chemotaxis response regulator CheB
VTARIRVLVVDDSAFVRKAVKRMLGTADDIEVVGFAADGEEGLVKARDLQPDVVTLDIKMPRLGGLETLERLMAEQPVPVLLMSTLTQEGAEVTLRGLELGAMDFVDKSSVQPMSMLSLAEELVAKVRALGRARVRARPRPARPSAEGAAAVPADCVVIAASTGGPRLER